MEKKLDEVLHGGYGNYILPFFWQHGEPEDVLVKEIEKIYESGIRSMCIESRTHEEFAHEGWFHDFDIIMREAKKRGMTVWLLDDKHFPTGYANGLVGEKYPQLRKWHIIEQHADVIGPQKGALMLNAKGSPNPENERSLICAVAFPRPGGGEELAPEPIDLTDHVKGNFLYWDVPDGCYRVFVLYKSREGCTHKDYIHMIDPESVNVLIEAVYEPHYARYKEEFGKTFAGFFSDEPCFGNGMVGSFGLQAGFYDHKVGTPYLSLPWRDDLVQMLTKELGYDATLFLPALWYPMAEKTSAVRTAYMNIITRLYQKCFCEKIGDWCRAHGVEYIGHIIEDMNCHTHLGPGAGHYFRSLAGQDMSGIDVVLQQIVPGMSHHKHTCVCYGGAVDPEFFDYLLAKLAASLSNLQPRMKGRAMCEMYGAYGWAEGTPMMKWLTDHMLVRGINHFVPHAFTPKFPDNDCPPHFYAQGQNPQYRDFRLLMEYANKMSHLLTDGRHVASAAILYHAEAEWSGEPCMFAQVPAKLLYDAQIDYDILPSEAICAAGVKEKKLVVNQESFGCVVVPYARALPFELLKKLSALADAGVDVVFVEGLPEKSIENLDASAYIGNKSFLCVGKAELAETLVGRGHYDVRLKGNTPLLRVYHYVRGGADFYMFFNEGMNPVDDTVVLPLKGLYLSLDVLQGTAVRRETDGNTAPVHLEPYESRVLVFGEGFEGFPAADDRAPAQQTMLNVGYRVETADMNSYPSFTLLCENAPLQNITAPDVLPEFGGIIRYTTHFDLDSPGRFVLDLGEVGETAHVWVNDIEVGARVCRPYRLDITRAVKQKGNTLVVEVANSLAYQERDGFSDRLLIAQSGLLGPVVLSRYED